MNGILDYITKIWKRWKVKEWRYKICDALLLIMKLELNLLVPAVLIWRDRNWGFIELRVLTDGRRRWKQREEPSQKKSVSRSGWRVIRPADDNAVIRKRHKMGIANDLSYQTLGKRLWVTSQMVIWEKRGQRIEISPGNFRKGIILHKLSPNTS